jgi:hypothetical protein
MFRLKLKHTMNWQIRGHHLSILKGSSAINRVIPHEYRPSFHVRTHHFHALGWQMRNHEASAQDQSRCINLHFITHHPAFRSVTCFPVFHPNLDPQTQADPATHGDLQSSTGLFQEPVKDAGPPPPSLRRQQALLLAQQDAEASAQRGGERQW